MGGDQPTPSPYPVSQSMADVMKAQIKYLPELTAVTGENIAPFEQYLMDAQREFAPQYAQEQLDLYRDYAPQLNQIGTDVRLSNQAQTAAGEADILNNQGADLVRAANQAARIADPEYYQTRETGANALGELIKSYDISKGLSGSELANVERGLNRVNQQNGNVGNNSPSAAIQNAFAFDDRLQQKKSGLAQALQMVPQNLASFKSGVDVMQQAVGRSSTPNSGDSRFLGVSPAQVGAGTQNMSQQMLNAGTQLQAAGLNYGAQNYATDSQFATANSPIAIFGQVAQGIGNIASAVKP